MNECQRGKCVKVTKKLMKNKSLAQILDLIDTRSQNSANEPDENDDPVSLMAILSKLENLQYGSLDAYISDVQRIFSKCLEVQRTAKMRSVRSIVTKIKHSFDEDMKIIREIKINTPKPKSGGNFEWVQCFKCLKWRKVSRDLKIPERWQCGDNCTRYTCLTPEDNWYNDRSLNGGNDYTSVIAGNIRRQNLQVQWKRDSVKRVRDSVKEEFFDDFVVSSWILNDKAHSPDNSVYKEFSLLSVTPSMLKLVETSQDGDWESFYVSYKRKHRDIKDSCNPEYFRKLYEEHVKPYEKQWLQYCKSVEKSQDQIPSSTAVNSDSGICSICRKACQTPVCFSCQCHFKASWDNLKLCIICGFRIYSPDPTSYCVCGCCSGCAHVSCVGQYESNWVCNFCLKRRKREQSLYYSIDDPKSRVLSPYYV